MQLQNNKQSFGFLIIILGIVFLGVIIYFVFFYNFSKTKTINQPIVEKELPENKIHIKEANNVSTSVKNISKDNNIKTENATSPFEDVRQLSSFFTERIGTWSNQASESNLADLKFFMTQDMKDWADMKIKDSSRFNDYENYYGITTKVVSTDIVEHKDDKAVVIVHTKRSEEKNNKIRVFNQDMKLELVKKTGEWKIDGAYWKK